MKFFFSKSRITARVKNINIHFSYCYNDKIRKKLGNCQKQSNKQTKIDSRSISKASKQSLLLLLLLLAIIFLLLLNWTSFYGLMSLSPPLHFTSFRKRKKKHPTTFFWRNPFTLSTLPTKGVFPVPLRAQKSCYPPLAKVCSISERWLTAMATLVYYHKLCFFF